MLHSWKLTVLQGSKLCTVPEAACGCDDLCTQAVLHQCRDVQELAEDVTAEAAAARESVRQASQNNKI